jgi:hypothetical protein
VFAPDWSFASSFVASSSAPNEGAAAQYEITDAAATTDVRGDDLWCWLTRYDACSRRWSPRVADVAVVVAADAAHDTDAEMHVAPPPARRGKGGAHRPLPGPRSTSVSVSTAWPQAASGATMLWCVSRTGTTSRAGPGVKVQR